MKTVLLLLLLPVAIPLFAQVQPPVVTGKPLETTQYEKKIMRKIKGLGCYNDKENYSVLYVYTLNAKQNSREVFTNELLLKNLDYFYRDKKNKGFPVNSAYVYNDSLKVVATSDDLQVLCNHNFPPNQAIVKFAVENKIDFMFFINGTNIKYLFAVKDGLTRVIEIQNNDSLKVLPLEEFVTCCWDNLHLSHASK